MKKIAFVIPTLNIGGAEVFCANLCEEVARHEEFDVHLIVFYHSVNEKFNYIVNNEKIHIHFLYKTVGFSLSFFIRYKKLIKQLKPDIINTHMSFSINYLLLMPFAKKINIFHTLTSDPHNYNKKLFPLYKKRSHQKSWSKLHFVCISDAIADMFADVYDYPREKIATIYNGVKPLVKPLTNDNHFDFINCASHYDIKNQQLLINALHILNDKNVKTCFAGDGPLKQSYEKLIADFKMNDEIILLGRVADPTPYYYGSRFFILTSKTEGSPVSIIEAFSAGLPVIAPRVGGIPDLVSDGVNGFLFDANITPEDLAKLLRKILNLDEITLAKIASNNIEKVKKWRIDIIANQYIDLFNKIS